MFKENYKTGCKINRAKITFVVIRVVNNNRKFNVSAWMKYTKIKKKKIFLKILKDLNNNSSK